MAIPVWPERVDIVEVGLRDGLQRESTILSAGQKLKLIADLLAAGLQRIQVTSFVHPRRVPQMADAEAVCAGLPQLRAAYPDAQFSGLVLNARGLERAAKAGLRHVDLSVSASDDHSRRNMGMGVEEALAAYRSMYRDARAAGLHVRGGVQCAFGYRSASDVSAVQVLAISEELLGLGVEELALADSAGMADPRQVGVLLGEMLPLAKKVPLILHLHDTRGMGLSNLLAALQFGVSCFDTAFGGLGGCPFIDGASGNIATEDTVHMLERMGIDTGADASAVAAVALRAQRLLGRSSLPGKLASILHEAVAT